MTEEEKRLRHNEAQKRYYQRNRQKCNESCKKRYQERKEQYGETQKAYRERPEIKEKYRTYNKLYYHRNWVKILEGQRKRYYENREIIRKYKEILKLTSNGDNTGGNTPEAKGGV